MALESPIKILHLEDNLNDAQLVMAMLKKANVEFDYFFTDNEKEYLFFLENQQIDIILSDYHLPDFSGTDALLIAKSKYPHIPFVFVSGTMGEDVAIESLLNGATDYVLKNRMERLGSAVNRAFKEAQDQKARLIAEKALLQSEENFHRSISESPLGIRIVTVDGKTIYANKTFLDIYEFNSLDEFNSTPAKNRYSLESYLQHQERKEKRQNGEEVSDYELSIVRKNKDIRFVKVSRKEIIWDGIRHYQVINQDITDQKKLTLDLIEAKEKAEESDRLKTAFLHNISHEIRTPMNAIVGFSEFLNDPDLLPEHRNQYIGIIVMSSNHLLSIITDIISIATIEAGQEKVNKTETNLNSTLGLIQKQFLIRAEKQNIILNLIPTLTDTDLKILTDETKLVQILTNLINNALKFTSKGYINFGYNIVETKHALSLLQFFVEDTGIGIPSEMQGEIFKRFRQVENATTRNFGGSGLGLAITKAYVELLGGNIWVESEVGKGSTFYFTLPYNP
jgi:PAS domain S-box-containing protein